MNKSRALHALKDCLEDYRTFVKMTYGEDVFFEARLKDATNGLKYINNWFDEPLDGFNQKLTPQGAIENTSND